MVRLEDLELARQSPSGDSVDAWLRILRNLLHLPEPQISNICDELEMHLRERIRDLQVAGMDESDAIRTAIGELGDAAVLAGRYRSATRSKHRRLTMNIAVAIVAGTAAVLSVVAVSRVPQMPRPGAESKPRADQSAQTLLDRTSGFLEIVPSVEGSELVLRPTLRTLAFDDAAPEQGDHRIGDVGLDEITLGELFDRLAQRLDASLRVRWSRLEQYGIMPGTEVLIIGENLDLPDVFAQVNEGLSDLTTLDYRIHGKVFEVADRSDLDRRELRLVTYDIGPILTAGNERFNQSRESVLRELLETLHQFVSPNDWADNGGILASQTIVGDKLFVEAPPRMHRQIKWILEQLVATNREVRINLAGEARALKVYPLKHIDAAAALEMLHQMGQFHLIDLRLDPRTNSILGIAETADHKALSKALAALDKVAD